MDGQAFLLLSTVGELVPRNQVFSNYVMFLILLSLGLLAWVKWLYPETFRQVFRRLFQKTNLSTDFIPNTSRMLKAGYLLTLNFFVSVGVFLYFVYAYFDITQINMWVLITIPCVYFYFLHTCLFFAGFLSGEFDRLKTNFQLVTLVHQAIGVILIPVNIIWFLNSNYSSVILYFLLGVAVFFYGLRLIKGFFLAFQNNVFWFYIILYFCTLEILPMIIVYQFLTV